MDLHNEAPLSEVLSSFMVLIPTTEDITHTILTLIHNDIKHDTYAMKMSWINPIIRLTRK